jgi:hypothetical protein
MLLGMVFDFYYFTDLLLLTYYDSDDLLLLLPYLEFKPDIEFKLKEGEWRSN